MDSDTQMAVIHRIFRNSLLDLKTSKKRGDSGVSGWGVFTFIVVVGKNSQTVRL